MSYNIGGMVTGQDEIAAMFSTEEPEVNDVQEPDNEGEGEPSPDENIEKQNITEMPLEDIFGSEEASERVGNDEDDNPEGQEREHPSKEEGSSPDKNLYSSIANLLYEDGVLSNLSEDDVKKIANIEDLGEAVNKWAYSRLDDAQKRVTDALNAEIPVSQIKQYENTIATLNNITEEQLTAEDTEGENLRKAIIYQYLRVAGSSEERAQKMLDRTIAGGTDVEDAKEYLESLKKHYNDEYNNLIKTKEKEVQENKKQQEARVNKIKESLLKDEHILGDVVVDAKTRQLALDYWMKPTHKTEDGVFQSELQKYIAENPEDFQKNVAIIFALTDKFKNMGNLVKPTVKKEKKKALQELETVINGTRRTPSGALDLNLKDPDSNFNTLRIAPVDKW